MGVKFTEKLRNLCLCVCVCMCVCVCVCVCVFNSFCRKDLAKQRLEWSARIQVSDGVMMRYFCIKDLHLRVIDIHKKNFELATVKDYQQKLGETTRSKRQLL